MQLRSDERMRFYYRIGFSGGLFILFLSLAANVFLLLTRPPEVPPSVRSASEPLKDRLLLEPLSFGNVNRGFSIRPQLTSGTSAVLPVGSYDVPDGVIPKLPAQRYLYRDQGIQLDDLHMKRMLQEMNLPLPWESIGLLPVQEKWRSSDRTMEFVLDTEKRSLTVSVLGAFGPSPEGRADDETAIQIAKMFIQKFSIDMSNFGIARVIEKQAEGGPSRTYVVWSMAFDGLPLVDWQGQPVYGAQVQVGRLSRRALSATFTLLSADAFPKSSYPTATPDQIRAGLVQGGVLPAPKDTAKKPSVVKYAASQEAYILYPGDREHPTYIVPGLYAVWMQPACPKCGEIQIPTIIPVLNPEKFAWYVKPPAAPTPLSSAATQTGSTKK